MKYLCLAVSALALSACVSDVADSKRVNLTASEVQQIKAAESRDLKDPFTARFQNIRAADVTLADGSVVRRVCGEVNARNSYGAYTGYTWFGGVMTGGVYAPRDFSGACE